MAIWKTQWNRIRRYEQRLDEMQYIQFDRQAAYFCDDLHAFFIECHSFKDWLINDDEFLSELQAQAKKDRIEDFVYSSEPLVFCRDIAIGKKHLAVREYKSGAETGLKLGLEVILEDDGEQRIYDCSPDRHTRERNSRILDEAFRRSESCFDEVARELSKHETDRQNALDWEASTRIADAIKAHLRQEGFGASDIFINVTVDVQHGGKLLKFDRGVTTLAENCTSEWIEFLKTCVPRWNE